MVKNIVVLNVIRGLDLSQSQILTLLEKNKNKIFDSKELSLLLNININSVTKNLSQLRRYDMIEFEHDHVSNKYIYWHKEDEI